MSNTIKEELLRLAKRVYFNGSTDSIARANGVIPKDTLLGETQIDIEVKASLSEISHLLDEAKPTTYPSNISDEATEYIDRVVNQYSANIEGIKE